ncbi:uncharacterized protein [Apostichopus japonicus]|uniref:uncharacterized protein isoform X3 n=1 Tax=Stichopus japonicus TaxID=307972 RepID=UPI003AB62FFC
MMNQFAVVEFVAEGSVEVVSRKWIAGSGENLHCYWPRNNATLKAKRGEIPDPERWSKHKVRVFRFVDENEDNPENAMSAPVAAFPKPPVISGIRQKRQLIGSIDAVSHRSLSTWKKSIPGSNSQQHPDIFPPPTVPSPQEPPPPTTPTNAVTLVSPRRASQSNMQENLELTVLMKPDTIIENQKEGLSLLRTLARNRHVASDEVMLEEIFVVKMTTVQQMNELPEKLKEENYKKKLVNLNTNLLRVTIKEM